MVGISKSERKRRADIKELEEKLNKEMPLYVFKGLRGNLNTLMRKQEKAEADRKATAKERGAKRRAKEIREMGFVPCSHLPRNGREPPDGYVGPTMYFDLAEFLDQQAINKG